MRDINECFLFGGDATGSSRDHHYYICAYPCSCPTDYESVEGNGKPHCAMRDLVIAVVDGTHSRASSIAPVKTRFLEHGSEINHCVLSCGDGAYCVGTCHYPLEVDQFGTSSFQAYTSKHVRPGGRASRRRSTSSKVAPNTAQDPLTFSFSHDFLRESGCNFSQQVLAHFIQSGRRLAQICELFAEQGIGYALWSSGQVHHRVVLFGADVACSRDQTPRNLHPLVHLSQAVTRASIGRS